MRAGARVSELAIEAAGVRLTVAGADSVPQHYSARLVVAADGAHSQVRAAAGIGADVEDYEQVALVANVASDQPHAGRAFERFTAHGPLAVLPLYDGSRAIIWACTPQNAQRLLALDDGAYLQRAARGLRLACRALHPRRPARVLPAAPHPRRSPRWRRARCSSATPRRRCTRWPARASISACAMRRCWRRSSRRPAGMPARPSLLTRFAAWRAADRSGVMRFTDGLVKLFGDTRPGVGVLRNLGLLLFDLAAPAKSALARVSSGFGGPAPRLARGLPVRHG